MPRNSRSGFSLLEILIVITIAAAVVLVVGNFSNNIAGLNGLVSQELQSKSDVNQLLQTAGDEIRSMGQSGNGAYPIAAAGTSSFTFFSDVRKTGVTERVRYFLASSSIYKGVVAPTGTPVTYPTSTEVITDIIDKVILAGSSTPLFSYYDSAYTGSGQPMAPPIAIPAIRLVGISFTVNTNASGTSAPENFSTLVEIRNLKSN